MRPGSRRLDERRMYFAGYRDVDDLNTALPDPPGVGADTVEDTTLDRIRIDAMIDPGKFEAPT